MDLSFWEVVTLHLRCEIHLARPFLWAQAVQGLPLGQLVPQAKSACWRRQSGDRGVIGWFFYVFLVFLFHDTHCQLLPIQLSIAFFWMTSIMYSRELLIKTRRLTTWYFTVRVGVRRHARKQCRLLLLRQSRVGRFSIIYQVHDHPTKNPAEAPV